MITFKDGCKIAYDHYKQQGKNGLHEAMDFGDAWLFAGGDPDHIIPGEHSITVDKKSGKVETFFLPDIHNFKRLDAAELLAVPDEYKYKG